MTVACREIHESLVHESAWSLLQVVESGKRGKGQNEAAKVFPLEAFKRRRRIQETVSSNLKESARTQRATVTSTSQQRRYSLALRVSFPLVSRSLPSFLKRLRKKPKQPRSKCMTQAPSKNVHPIRSDSFCTQGECITALFTKTPGFKNHSVPSTQYKSSSISLHFKRNSPIISCYTATFPPGTAQWQLCPLIQVWC